MKPQVCQVCGDDVVFGRLLPTGAICVDCGDVAADVLPGPLAAVAALEPEAPTDNTHQGEGESSAPSPTKAPRAAEEQQESKGEPAPRVLAGDRAKMRESLSKLPPMTERGRGDVRAALVPSCPKCGSTVGGLSYEEAVAWFSDGGGHRCATEAIRGGVVGRPEVATRPAHDAGRSTTPPIEDAPMCGICGCTRLKGHIGSCITHEDGAEVVRLAAEAFDVEIAHVRAFQAPKTREIPSLEVEEWVYITRTHVPHLSLMERLALLRTPREIFPGQLEESAGGFEVCRFVVVLEWRMSGDSDITLRDIGPSFQPRMGSRDDRAAALNTATAWARGQAKKLKAVGPIGYRAAREIS